MLSVSLNTNNSINKSNQSFRGNAISVPRPNEVALRSQLKKDVVEVSDKKQKKKKKGLSRGAKFGIAFASIIAASVLALKFGPRVMAAHNVKKKLPIRNLPEKIDFAEAKTIEEARKYAKEVLQIKEVDDKLSLEALNIVNKGLTDVSNSQKGKVVMPTALRLTSLKDANAAVVSSLNTKDLGEMLLDEKLFTLDNFSEFVNKDLKMPNGKNVFYRDASGKYCSSYIHNGFFKPRVDDDLAKLLNKFYSNPESLSIQEKLSLKLIIGSAMPSRTVSINEPRVLLVKFKNEFQKRGINYELSDFSGKSDNEVIEFIREKVSPIVNSSRNYIDINLGLNEQYSTIYHEMGHLQDINKNYGVITEKMDFFKILRTKLLPSTNHFGKKDDKEIVELLKTETGRNLLKKEAPLTYEFITDKSIQDIASEVSSYATTGIGEFIAETYAHMQLGLPLSDRVKNLYKKYNGPMLP